jgi:hypothetical protein
MTRDEAKNRLRRTIDVWKDQSERDRHSEGVCERLLDSEAHMSFAAIRPDGTRWNVLLQDCIIAERNSRELWQIVAGAAEDERRANEAAGLIERLVKILGSGQPAAGQPDFIGDALNLLRVEAYTRRLAARNCIREHSRKTDAAAATSAAVGWIKESVRRASAGRGKAEHVKVLADAALGIMNDSVTEDTIRRAVEPSDALNTGGYTRAKRSGAHSNKIETS